MDWSVKSSARLHHDDWAAINIAPKLFETRLVDLGLPIVSVLVQEACKQTGEAVVWIVVVPQLRVWLGAVVSWLIFSLT